MHICMFIYMHTVHIYVYVYIYVYIYVAVSTLYLSCHCVLEVTPRNLFVPQISWDMTNQATWKGRGVMGKLTLQTCLLCGTAGVSAVSRSRLVCHVTQQTCLLCDTADTCAAWRSRHFFCVNQQTCLLCDTADVSAVPHTQQTCLLSHVESWAPVDRPRRVNLGDPRGYCELCWSMN